MPISTKRTAAVCPLAFLAVMSPLKAGPSIVPDLREIAPLQLAQLEDIDRRLPQPTQNAPTQSQEPNLTPVPELRDPAIVPFVLASVKIEGATAFAPDEFAPLYEKYLATSPTLSQITELTDAITKMYRDAGYFLSRAIAPPQDGLGGVLTIRVIEGYAEHVGVKGAPSSQIKNAAKTVGSKAPAAPARC